MTKKDYELIASVLNTLSKEERYKPDLLTTDDVIAAMANVLSKDNARFNKDNFFDACYKVDKS